MALPHSPADYRVRTLIAAAAGMACGAFGALSVTGFDGGVDTEWWGSAIPEIVGAAIGSIVTIGGAVGLWRFQERWREKALLQSAHTVYENTVTALHALSAALPDPKNNWQVLGCLQDILDELQNAAGRLHGFEPAISQMSYKTLTRYFELDRAAGHLRRKAKGALQQLEPVRGNPAMLEDGIARLGLKDLEPQFVEVWHRARERPLDELRREHATGGK